MVNNQVFNSVIKIKKDASDHVYYHNARKLVEIYRSVTWGLQYNFDEMTDACKDMGYSDIEEALCFVEDGTVDGNAIRYMEDRTLSMKYTNLLVYIIERALLALRDWAAPNLCTKYRVSGGGIVKVSYTAYTML